MLGGDDHGSDRWYAFQPLFNPARHLSAFVFPTTLIPLAVGKMKPNKMASFRENVSDFYHQAILNIDTVAAAQRNPQYTIHPMPSSKSFILLSLFFRDAYHC
jgi:hypothetical protein